jgi:hypothetical protein
MYFSVLNLKFKKGVSKKEMSQELNFSMFIYKKFFEMNTKVTIIMYNRHICVMVKFFRSVIKLRKYT